MQLGEHLERARELLRAGDTVSAVMHAMAVLDSGDATHRTEGNLLAGLAWAVAGSWTDAEGHLLEALAGDLEDKKAYALYHLALVYEHTRRPDVAASLYASAADEWRLRNQTAEATKAHLNACWMLAVHGRLPEAMHHLESAYGDPAAKNAHKALSAFLRLQSGDTAAALAMANEVAAAGEEPWSTCLAAYVGGVVAAHQDQVDLGRQMYQTGAALLPQTGDTRLMNLYVDLRRMLP